MLFLDGLYVKRPDGRLRFRGARAPTRTELTELANKIARRVRRFLERQGFLERDAENSGLAGDDIDDDPMSSVLGAAFQRRSELYSGHIARLLRASRHGKSPDNAPHSPKACDEL